MQEFIAMLMESVKSTLRYRDHETVMAVKGIFLAGARGVMVKGYTDLDSKMILATDETIIAAFLNGESV